MALCIQCRRTASALDAHSSVACTAGGMGACTADTGRSVRICGCGPGCQPRAAGNHAGAQSRLATPTRGPGGVTSSSGWPLLRDRPIAEVVRRLDRVTRLDSLAGWRPRERRARPPRAWHPTCVEVIYRGPGPPRSGTGPWDPPARQTTTDHGDEAFRHAAWVISSSSRAPERAAGDRHDPAHAEDRYAAAISALVRRWRAYRPRPGSFARLRCARVPR